MTDQPTSNITLRESRSEFGKEIIRIDHEGFHYKGEFIADAGEAHRLMVEFLKQNTQPKPKRPTVMEIIELHTWMEDEWGANNNGEDLPMVDFARGVLARWGN